MKHKTAARILSVIANALLAAMGGGLCLVLTRFAPGYSQEYNEIALGVIALILLGLGAVVFVVEFVSMFKISDSTAHTMFVALFLDLFFLCSPDMGTFFFVFGAGQMSVWQEIFAEVFYVAASIALFSFFRHNYRPGGKKISLLPLFIAGAICCPAYIALVFFGYRLAAHAAFVLTLTAFFVVLQVRIYRAGLDDATFAFSAAILFACTGMQTADVLWFAGITDGCAGWSSGYFSLCLLCFAAIYIAFAIRTEQAARRAAEYKLQAERLKTRLLVEQIKPHFVFNALTTIKSMYHKDTDAGDKALGLFSEYLRESIGAVDTDTVPFERELNNIARYVEFCNQSLPRKFNVIYDIDDADFSVPAFSLQPFVENAVKYSRVNERADGYILISAYADGGDAVVKIADNGVGFDTEKIKKSSHGIRNACERLRLLSNAEPAVSSGAQGTVITVRIPRKGEEKA